MAELELIDILGHWLAIFLTLAVFSFLYKDNPIYKVAEHLFIGVSIGYVVVYQFYDTLYPLLFAKFPALLRSVFAESRIWDASLLTVLELVLLYIGLLFVIFMFAKFVAPRHSWLGRYPLAFLIAVYAALQVNGLAEADLGKQIKVSGEALQAENWEKANINTSPPAQLGKAGFPPSVVNKIMAAREQGERFSSVDDVLAHSSLTDIESGLTQDMRSSFLGIDGLDRRVTTENGTSVYWFGLFSQLLLLLGTLCTLIYFFFSVPHKGAVGVASRIGIVFLMVAFGAAFGFTVQGRVTLAFGRVQELTGRSVTDMHDGQIHSELTSIICLVVIIALLVLWELWRKKPAE